MQANACRAPFLLYSFSPSLLKQDRSFCIPLKKVLFFLSIIKNNVYLQQH